MTRTTAPSSGTRSGRRPLALLAAAALLASSGCTTGGTTTGGGNTVADQAQEVAGRDYISGDGRIETLGPEQRGEPVDLSGQTIDGESWNSADLRGDVVVLNVWGSWCPPCVEEMPDLQAAWQQLEERDEPVHFMGVNVNEAPATASAFLDRFEVTYPSLRDDGGVALIALQERASVPPTTLVLDAQGRIAARVAGQVTESTLVGLVDDVLAQG